MVLGPVAHEALAAGVPLVVSNLPVLREVFAGAARFADDPAELAAQLMTALIKPDPAARCIGRALAARHTWSAAVQQHLKLYRLLSRRDHLTAPAISSGASRSRTACAVAPSWLWT